MSEEGTFESDSIQDPEGLRQFLSALAQGFATGRIVLRSEGEEVVMLPTVLLGLSVKARRKASEGKISIKIGWKDTRKEISAAGASVLIVP